MTRSGGMTKRLNWSSSSYGFWTKP